MDPFKLLDGLKLSPKPLAGLAAATGVFLALRPEALAFLGLTGVNSAIRPWAAGAFIASISLLAVHGASGLTALGKRWWDRRKVKKRRDAALRDLSPMEKEVLGAYVTPDAKLVSLAAGSGIAERLVADDILYRESAEWAGKHPYNIRPWAKEYLERHPEFLEPDDLPPPADTTGEAPDEPGEDLDPTDPQSRGIRGRDEEMQRILAVVREVNQRRGRDKKKNRELEGVRPSENWSWRVRFGHRMRKWKPKMPSGANEWTYACAFLLFGLSMFLLLLSFVVGNSVQSVFVDLGFSAFFASLVALGFYFLMDVWDFYKAVRDFPENQRAWIRGDLRRAATVLGKLRKENLTSLRVVKNYLELAVRNRRTRLGMVVGAIERVGLLPAYSGACLAWAKGDSENSEGWIWLAVALQVVTLFAVQYRYVIEQLELECWVAGEAVREREDKEKLRVKRDGGPEVDEVEIDLD